MSHIIRFAVLSLTIACAVTLVYAQVNNEPRMKQRHHSVANEMLPMSVPAATPELVSFRKPDGLIVSEGNLYFTTHDAIGASVWRADQNSIPGKEILLYWEAGGRFGDIVFAQVDGTFFGYFFATNPSGTVQTIKRVPLTGGPAVVLATVTNVDVFNGHRNLITDGKSLFWQDLNTIRAMPIRGGPVNVIDRAAPGTPAGLALHNGNVLIYASGSDLRFLPTTGINVTNPALRTIVTGPSRVTALHVVQNFLYWGDQGGAIRVTAIGQQPSTNMINSFELSPNLIPTSIGTSTKGGVFAQAWTVCSPQSCRLHFDIPSGEDSFRTIGANAIGVSITQSQHLFWGDAAGVHRYVP